jgi:hypothetical protein
LREDSLFTPQHNCGAVVCRVDSSFCLSLRANGAGEEPYQRFPHLLRSTPKNGQKSKLAGVGCDSQPEKFRERRCASTRT